MGQKIHPLGFRVGITKKHQSVWFARFQKHQYAQSVLEDRFLRQNLLKLLPQLFQKKFNNSTNMPKISHIQIVRGLIPYEIGIQIYAQNCHMIKTAFEGLDVQPSFVQNLLKNHFILEKTASKKNVANSLKNENVEFASNFEKISSEQKIENFNRLGGALKVADQNAAVLKGSNAKKDAKAMIEKRKKLFAHFRQRFLGKFIIVKNGKKITKKFDPKKQSSFRNNLVSYFKKNFQERRRNFRKNKFGSSFSTISSNKKAHKIRDKFSAKQKAYLGFFKSKTLKPNLSKPCAKFVNIYMSQTNSAFLNALKLEMNYWNQYFAKSKNEQLKTFGTFRYLPIGSQKKWSSLRFKRFEKLSLPFLLKLFKALQQRALKKLERLRKEYLVFGKFSKTKTLSYYQRIRFLQNFKKFIVLRKTQKSSILSQSSFENVDSSQKTTNQKFASKVALFNEKSIQKKFSNIHGEKNTMKFIDYLQNLVKQHRSKNLFLYLATISDARQNLRKIQYFTKQQSEFLFGVSSKNYIGLTPEEKQEILKKNISKTFLNISQKNLSQKKNFVDIFVEQLQKQRTICEQNIQLTPKISIQFYSVKAQDFQTRASAVADSIVDDLEKRKAFRRVIKKAKEDLMKTPKVKGVKIQVSGRLNGAEIARSEWVRAGRVPLQTLRANIDYCYKTAQTIYGIIGVKVWIYKGYTKTRRPSANSISLLPDLL
uniref:ribosomal protein S3 n=1 Tax=Coelastrella saipanensis TaxID=152631 RepID=UPI0010C381A5|nr:ribosomal protein S3 [Coelastrella saipanensis]AVV61541.1 ribosomal protein S3 [Coelastrella saipanensis]